MTDAEPATTSSDGDVPISAPKEATGPLSILVCPTCRELPKSQLTIRLTPHLLRT